MTDDMLKKLKISPDGIAQITREEALAKIDQMYARFIAKADSEDDKITYRLSGQMAHVVLDGMREMKDASYDTMIQSVAAASAQAMLQALAPCNDPELQRRLIALATGPWRFPRHFPHDDRREAIAIASYLMKTVFEVNLVTVCEMMESGGGLPYRFEPGGA
jgi:hypothetical protein